MLKSFTLGIFFLVLIISASLHTGFACNLSNVTLCGITPGPGTDTTICLILCTGYGRTGATKGANSDTRSISFGWYDSDSGFVINAFTPASITSARGFSNCSMGGANIGAVPGAPYYSQGTVLYADPGYYNLPPCVDQPFGCVSTTADCGNAAQQCITYTFRVNQVPDSVRVFGVEGAGNPVAGCYPDADMMVDFTTLVVEWGTVEGIAQSHAVKVKWTTLSETNTDLFVVERAVGGSDFAEIGTVAAKGNSLGSVMYEFLDLAPMPGVNRYRIIQVDNNGNTALSPAVEVNFQGPAGLAWGAVGPNPATDFLNLTFFHEHSETMVLSLHDMEGKAVIQKNIQAVSGANTLRIALEEVNSGVYFVSLQGDRDKLTRKIVRL